ncbi:hypothetical protein [Streptomyces sp. NPDC002685]|uniref:VMAP-C domain-containing protein n=1 Tax=Streptomyces sp. NPDC002685 TaxID=3154540 RepID=UPI00331B7912
MNESGGYDELLTLLAGPEDFWDRPTGDWSQRDSDVGGVRRDVREALQDANAAYLLGTKALRRSDLDSAEAWFAVAFGQRHPGAAFRAALTRLLATAPSKSVLFGQAGSGKSRAMAAHVVAHTGSGKSNAFLGQAVGSGKSRVLILLAAAARWGHGDAQHLIDRLRTGTGDRVIDEAGRVGELMAIADNDDLAGTVLIVDSVPYEPEDSEFYPTTLTLLRQCFAAHDPASQPPTRLGQQSGLAEHQVLTSAPRPLGAGGDQELRASADRVERGSSRWGSMTDECPVVGIFLPSGEKVWARVSGALAQEQLLGAPVALWDRRDSCCSAARGPWDRDVSQRPCPRCVPEPTSFTAALLEALETGEQAPSLPSLTLLTQAAERIRAQRTHRCADQVGLGSHLALLWDDPRDLSTEASAAVRAQNVRSSAGPIAENRAFNEFLRGGMDASPSAGVEGYVADRALILATALCDDVGSRQGGQVAASVFGAGMSIKALATGFEPSRPGLHMVRDEAQRLYLFAEPYGSPSDSEEPRLVVPAVVSSPPDNSKEAAQPITTQHATSVRRSAPQAPNHADPLQVYACTPRTSA